MRTAFQTAGQSAIPWVRSDALSDSPTAEGVVSMAGQNVRSQRWPWPGANEPTLTNPQGCALVVVSVGWLAAKIPLIFVNFFLMVMDSNANS